MNKTNVIVLISLYSTAAWPAAGLAQTMETGANEIVVTAQKRPQRITDVPLSISAYDHGMLEQLGASELDKVAAVTPGLVIQIQDKFSPGLVIRGITSDDSSPFAEQRVAVFQDGVAASQTTASYGELFDVDRIEVEKGPQSTLHGRSALNGGISIYQKRAQPEFGAEAKLAAGSYDYRQLDGVVNFPVGDSLALRLGARLRKRDGFVKDSDGEGSYNALDAQAYRSAVAWKPSESFRFDLIGVYDRDDTKGGVPFKSGTFVPRDATGAVDGDLRPSSPAHLTTFGDIPAPFFTRDIVNISGIAEWRLDDRLTLTSISGYRWSRAAQSGDNDGTATNIIQYQQRNGGEQFSEELRVNFKDVGIFEGFVGASWLDSKARMQLDQAFDERALSLLLNGTLQSLAPLGLTNDQINDRLGPVAAANLKAFHRDRQITIGNVTAYDVFADVTAHLTNRLDLFAGGRMSWVDKTTGIQGLLPEGPSKITGGAIFLASTPGQAPIRQDNSSRDPTWRAGAKYAVSDDVNLFIVYGAGRRSEILQPRASGIFTLAPAEKLRSVEGGIKMRALGGRFVGDASVYHYEYSNFQTRGFVGGILSTINAGKADATGFEAQGSVLLTPGATMFASYGYNKARLRSGLFAGNRFRNSPDHKFAVGGNFSAPMLGGVLSFAPLYSWQSAMFFNDDNDRSDLQTRSPAAFSDSQVDELQKAFGILSARLTYTPDSRPWSVTVAADNLADTRFVGDAGNGGDNFGIPTFVAGTRRLLTVELNVKF